MSVPAEGDARRRPSAAPFALWAILLGALAAVQAGFGGGLLPVLVQFGAATVSAAIGLGILASGRRGRRQLRGLRAVPELSMPTALAAVSVSAVVCGAAVGSWLIIGGVLGLALAAGGLVRERRAQRRARRRAARATAATGAGGR